MTAENNAGLGESTRAPMHFVSEICWNWRGRPSGCLSPSMPVLPGAGSCRPVGAGRVPEASGLVSCSAGFLVPPLSRTRAPSCVRVGSFRGWQGFILSYLLTCRGAWKSRTLHLRLRQSQTCGHAGGVQVMLLDSSSCAEGMVIWNLQNRGAAEGRQCTKQNNTQQAEQQAIFQNLPALKASASAPQAPSGGSV